MGPKVRYLGPEVPAENLIWQDPVPAVDARPDRRQRRRALKAQMLASGLGVAELVSTAWASASTFRGSDLRGGANGARIRLAPQKDRDVNSRRSLLLAALEGIQRDFNASSDGRQACAGRPDRARRQRCVEAAAKAALATRQVPFTPGAPTPRKRRPTSNPFAGARAAPPMASATTARPRIASPEEMLVDRRSLTLSAPEMTVLVGGPRVLGANSWRQSKAGVSPRGRGS